MRALNGTKVKDMVSIESLFTKFRMLSVNQLNAQIKLVEMWKAMNMEDYPLKIDLQTCDENRVSTRADSHKRPIEVGKTNLAQKTCISDALRLWNLAPEKVTCSKSLTQVKMEIKKFVRALPI